jgi:predicted transcriptional regulator
MMVRIKEDRKRIMMLAEMHDITPDEQETLNHLALNVGWQRAKEYAESLETRGATYRYTTEQVNDHFVPRDGIVARFVRNLFA